MNFEKYMENEKFINGVKVDCSTSEWIECIINKPLEDSIILKAELKRLYPNDTFKVRHYDDCITVDYCNGPDLHQLTEVCKMLSRSRTKTLVRKFKN